MVFGKALVKEFLRRGFKVIMVSRSLEKLENVRSAFLSQFPDSTIEVIAVDFSLFPQRLNSLLQGPLQQHP